jgi:hypothetical protein
MPEQITSEPEDMKLKLSLETSLSVLLIRLFRQIAADYRTVYAATGQILDAQVYHPELITALRPTYRRGGKKAGFELRDKFEIVSDNKEEAEGRTDVNLFDFAEKEPVARANVITETTDRQLRNFTLQFIVGSALNGIFPSNEDIAKDVSTRFVKRSRARSQNIAVTETLNAVDGSRLIELNTLSEAEVDIQAKKKEDAPVKSLASSLFREWQSREDEFVRFTHDVANGQVVEGTTEPFKVGNSLLMYPGDTSLGADIDEIAGCRCFAATFIR